MGHKIGKSLSLMFVQAAERGSCREGVQLLLARTLKRRGVLIRFVRQWWRSLMRLHAVHIFAPTFPVWIKVREERVLRELHFFFVHVAVIWLFLVFLVPVSSLKPCHKYINGI